MGLISRAVLAGRRSYPGSLPAYELSLKGHAIASGLCFAFIGSSTGSHVSSRIDNSIGALSGSTKPVWSPGRGLSFTAGAAGVSYVDWGAGKCPQTRDLALAPFSIVARIYYRGTSGGLCERNDNNSTNIGWFVGLATSTSRFGLTMERLSSNFAAYSGAPTTNKWVEVAICYPGGLTAANVKIYFDGVLQTLLVSSDGSGAQGSDSANNFYVGRASFSNSSAGNGSFDGIIEHLYIFRRFLRQEEVRALTVDPYLLFHDTAPAVGPFAAPTPVLASISPATVQRGATSYNVYMTGTSTNWVNGVTAVTVGGTGITVNSTTVYSSTYCSASITVASNATLGAHTVTVTTGSEVVSL